MMKRVVLKSNKELCFKWFEKFLFGEEFKEPEYNTSVEDNLWEILVRFKRGEWMESKKPKQVKLAFEKLKSCKPYFKSLLTPKGKVMYRGSVISYNSYKKLTKGKTSTIDRELGEIYIVDYVYKPKSVIQSWTTSKSIANRFGDADHGYVSAIMQAKTDDSFFGNPKLLDRLDKDAAQVSEKEVFRLGGDIKVKLIIKIPDED